MCKRVSCRSCSPMRRPRQGGQYHVNQRRLRAHDMPESRRTACLKEKQQSTLNNNFGKRSSAHVLSSLPYHPTQTCHGVQARPCRQRRYRPPRKKKTSQHKRAGRRSDNQRIRLDAALSEAIQAAMLRRRRSGSVRHPSCSRRNRGKPACPANEEGTDDPYRSARRANLITAVTLRNNWRRR